MLSLSLSLSILSAFSLDCSTLPSQVVQFDFFSDIDDWVVGNLNPNGAFGVPAMNKYVRDADPYGLSIWESATPYNRAQDLTCYIGKDFYIPGTPTWAEIRLKADNLGFPRINGIDLNCNIPDYLTIKTCTVTQAIRPGLNNLNITVVNSKGDEHNYGGVNYRLSVRTSVKDIEPAP